MTLAGRLRLRHAAFVMLLDLHNLLWATQHAAYESKWCLASGCRLFNWHPILMVVAWIGFATEALLAYRSPYVQGLSRSGQSLHAGCSLCQANSNQTIEWHVRHRNATMSGVGSSPDSMLCRL